MTGRDYPDRPIVGVGAVIVRGNQVVLVRRAKAPLEGEWSIPGGMVELGETLRQAVQREAREETSLEVEALDLLDVFDSIVRDAASTDPGISTKPKYHYVLADFLCRVKSGELHASGDALDARWVRLSELFDFRLTPLAEKVIQKAFNSSRQ